MKVFISQGTDMIWRNWNGIICWFSEMLVFEDEGNWKYNNQVFVFKVLSSDAVKMIAFDIRFPRLSKCKHSMPLSMFRRIHCTVIPSTLFHKKTKKSPCTQFSVSSSKIIQHPVCNICAFSKHSPLGSKWNFSHFVCRVSWIV